MKKLTAIDLQIRYKKAREKHLAREKRAYYEINSYIKTQNDKYLRKRDFYR